jgi:hypothetical protein
LVVTVQAAIYLFAPDVLLYWPCPFTAYRVLREQVKRMSVPPSAGKLRAGWPKLAGDRRKLRPCPGCRSREKSEGAENES